jgi:hypothetical protein
MRRKTAQKARQRTHLSVFQVKAAAALVPCHWTSVYEVLRAPAGCRPMLVRAVREAIAKVTSQSALTSESP